MQTPRKEETTMLVANGWEIIEPETSEETPSEKRNNGTTDASDNSESFQGWNEVE